MFTLEILSLGVLVSRLGILQSKPRTMPSLSMLSLSTPCHDAFCKGREGWGHVRFGFSEVCKYVEK